MTRSDTIICQRVGRSPKTGIASRCVSTMPSPDSAVSGAAQVQGIGSGHGNLGRPAGEAGTDKERRAPRPGPVPAPGTANASIGTSATSEKCSTTASGVSPGPIFRSQIIASA